MKDRVQGPELARTAPGWGPVEDGYAHGLTITVAHPEGVATVETVWTAEGGVAVSIDDNDCPMPAAVAAVVLAAVREAAAVPPPVP